MPECGSTQAGLLKLPDGRDEHNPCEGYFGNTFWCGEADVSDWRDRADVVFRTVRREWNRLVDTNTGRQDNVRALVDDYEGGYDVLPDASWTHAFGQDGAAVAVDQMVANIRLGACALERIEEELGAAGEHTINPGKTLSRDPGSVPKWVWVAAAAGAIWVLFGMPGLPKAAIP